MASGEPNEIPLYIQKIGLAAEERQSTQEVLESTKELGSSERSRAEARVRKYNLDIATYAEKINEALKKLAAAKAKERVDPVRVPESISDPQLSKYLLSVKHTVDQINESRMKELKRLPRDEKQLQIRIDEAQRIEQATKKALEQLRSESERVKQQIASRERALEERRRQLAPIKPRVDRAKQDKARVKEQVDKLERVRAERRRERQFLERRKAALDLKRKNEKRPQERVMMRRDSERLGAQIDEGVKFEREHIDFRVKEFDKVRGQLEDELKKLTEALRSGEKDIKRVEDELGQLREIQRSCKERMEQEEKRLAEVQAVLGKLQAVAAEPA